MKYYLIGIKGAGVSSLALILHNLGHSVSGYDDESKHQFTEDKLIEAGIKIYTGEDSGLEKDMIVIRSTAINHTTHKEMIKASQLNLTCYEYNEFLGLLTKEFTTIAISGCHGKTTTTSMLKEVIDHTLGCNYLVGDGTGHGNKDNKYFIIEACEYRRNFLAYHPSITVITNVDLDHVDYYKDLNDIKSAFAEFANNNTKDIVIIYGDDEKSRSLNITTKTLYYGLNDNNDIQAKNISYDQDGIHFDAYFKGEYYYRFNLPLYGEHLLLNSLAVLAVSNYLNIEAADIQKYLSGFRGANRRFNETIIGNSIVIDDYAHHHKEVAVTINAAKQKYPDKKIIAIFEPHTYSRIKEFASEIAQSLNLADEAYVLDIFKSRENAEDYPGVTSNLIIDNLNNGYFLNRSDNTLHKYHNAVFIFMSPKEIADIKERLINHLKGSAI